MHLFSLQQRQSFGAIRMHQQGLHASRSKVASKNRCRRITTGDDQALPKISLGTMQPNGRAAWLHRLDDRIRCGQIPVHWCRAQRDQLPLNRSNPDRHSRFQVAPAANGQLSWGDLGFQSKNVFYPYAESLCQLKCDGGVRHVRPRFYRVHRLSADAYFAGKRSGRPAFALPRFLEVILDVHVVI
jgi:hypothetical protein